MLKKRSFLLFLLFILLFKNLLLAQEYPTPDVLSIILPNNYETGETIVIKAIIADNLGLNNIKKVELHFKNSRGFRGISNMELNKTVSHEAKVYEYIGRVPSSYVTPGTLIFYIKTLNRFGEDEISQETQIVIPESIIKEVKKQEYKPKPTIEKRSRDSGDSTCYQVAFWAGIIGLGALAASAEEDRPEEERSQMKTLGIVSLVVAGVFAGIGSMNSFNVSKKTKLSINIGYDRVYKKNCYFVGFNYKF